MIIVLLVGSLYGRPAHCCCARRLRLLGLEPIDTEEELDQLRAESVRAAGRKFENDIDW